MLHARWARWWERPRTRRSRLDMPLDPRARRFLDMTAAAASPAPGRPSVAERRASLAKLMRFARADALSESGRDGDLPGSGGAVRYRLYTPSDAGRPTAGLVFFHGGGLVAGDLATHDIVCRALAEASGCRLLSID